MNIGQGTGPNIIPKDLPQEGSIILKSGNYKIILAPSRAFTMSECFYHDSRIVVSGGAQGAVIWTQQADKLFREKGVTDQTIWGDPWIGTAHGGEIVHKATLTVDGEKRPFETDAEITGRHIVVEKISTLYKFENRTKIVLTPEGLEEHRELQATEEFGGLYNFYLFMFSWVPSTQKFLAGFHDGSEQSEDFGENRSVTLNSEGSPPRWLAQYDPSLKLGILQFSPEKVPGNVLVQVRGHYHKYYVVFHPVRDRIFKAGELVKQTMYIKVLENETGDWEATRRAVKDFEDRFCKESTDKTK